MVLLIETDTLASVVIPTLPDLDTEKLLDDPSVSQSLVQLESR